MPIVTLEIETTDKSEAMRVLSELTSASQVKIKTLERLTEEESKFSTRLLVEGGFSSHEEEQ